jgi:hypothetical protein
MEKGIVLSGNKKGFEMAISTIIIIILSLVVLIALIMIFTKSTGTFGDKLSALLGTSNIDSVKDSCNLLVNQNSAYEYCCLNKTIKLGINKKVEMSCNLAREESWGNSIGKLNCEGIC